MSSNIKSFFSRKNNPKEQAIKKIKRQVSSGVVTAVNSDGTYDVKLPCAVFPYSSLSYAGKDKFVINDVVQVARLESDSQKVIIIGRSGMLANNTVTNIDTTATLINMLYSCGGWTDTRWARGALVTIAPLGSGSVFHTFADGEECGLFDGTYLWASKNRYVLTKDSITLQNALEEVDYSTCIFSCLDTSENIRKNIKLISENVYRLTKLTTAGVESHVDVDVTDYNTDYPLIQILNHKNYALAGFRVDSEKDEEDKYIQYDITRKIWDWEGVGYTSTIDALSIIDEFWQNEPSAISSFSGIATEDHVFSCLTAGTIGVYYASNINAFSYDKNALSTISSSDSQMKTFAGGNFGETMEFEKTTAHAGGSYEEQEWTQTRGSLVYPATLSDGIFVNNGALLYGSYQHSNNNYKFYCYDLDSGNYVSNPLVIDVSVNSFADVAEKSINCSFSETTTIKDYYFTDDNLLYLVYHDETEDNLKVGVKGIDILTESIIFSYSEDVETLPETQKLWIYGKLIGIHGGDGWKLIKGED